MVKRALIALFCLVHGLLIGVHSAFAEATNDIGRAVILQYHHIADHTPASTSLSPRVFRQHLEVLRDEGYSVWPLPRLVRALEGPPGVDAIPDKTVVITFDDAYDDIALAAAPLLREFGFAFTVFISTDFVDRKQKGYMTWGQLRDLTKQGATLANHSKSHLHLLRRPQNLSQQQWLKQIRAELDGAEARIAEETGDHYRYFAYPYGEANEAIIEAVRSWGYLGFGQQSGAVNARLLASGMAPRFPFNQLYQDIDDFRVKASSVPLAIEQERFQQTVWQQAVIPELELTLQAKAGLLTCFASGQGRITVKQYGPLNYRISANQPIPVGRSRYNCTMPMAGQPGRFHWYSRMWIRKQDDGTWYLEP